MTPEQIKVRCEQFGETWDFTREQLNDLESLYREAMAKGLEMAAVECEKRRMLCDAAAAQPYAENGWREKKILLGYLSEWCREQANKIKESTCDTSSS